MKLEEKTVRCEADGYRKGAHWQAWCTFKNVTFNQDTKLNIERIGAPEATDEDFERIDFHGSSSVPLVHPDILAKFPNIKMISLDVYSTKLNGLSSPYIIRNCKNLTHLELNLKDFAGISSDTFTDCKKLEKLRIKSDLLNDLPDNLFENQPNLFQSLKIKRLDYEGNPSHELNFPIEFLNLHGTIEELTIMNTNLSQIPENFVPTLRSMKQLKRFSLPYNSIRSVEAFVDLPNIELIALSRNNIQELPADAFKGCPRLTALFLKHNPIKALRGDEFNQLGGMKILSLWFSNLVSIAPTTFHPLTSLEQLSLGYAFPGQNHVISKELFMNSKNLKELDLIYNNIGKIHPEAFNNLHSLTSLELKGNRCVDENFSSPAGEVLNMTLVKEKLNDCFENFRGPRLRFRL